MKKFVEFGIYAFIFFLPWQTRWIFQADKINGGASEYLTYSFYGVDILILSLLLLALIYLKKDFFAFKKNASTFFLGVFVFLNLLSVVFLENQALGFYGEIRIFLGLILFWLIVKFSQPSKLAVWFVASLWIPAFLALWQFLTQATFANKWLGLSQHNAGLGGTSVIETFSDGIVSGRWLRAYGSFDHPNILGATLAIGLLVALALLLKLKKVAKLDYLKLFLLFSLVLFSAGLFVSFSRSAWLGLAGGIVFVAIFLFLQKRFIDLKNFLFTGVLIGLVFSIMSLGYHDLVGVRIGGSTRLESLSFDQRAVYLQQAKNMIFEKPFFGVGIGNYVPALIKSGSTNQIWTYQPVHNVFLLAWAELGIFGMLFLVAFLGNLFWQFGRKSPISGALLIAILPMLWLDHWFWSFHYGMLFFAIVVSLAVSFSIKEKV